MHVHEMLAALLHNPARFFKVAVTEGLLALPSVIAGIVNRCQLLMDRLIEFDPACFDVLFQEIMDRNDLALL
jgi:hypothetical protein